MVGTIGPYMQALKKSKVVGNSYSGIIVVEKLGRKKGFPALEWENPSTRMLPFAFQARLTVFLKRLYFQKGFYSRNGAAEKANSFRLFIVLFCQTLILLS